MRRDSDIRSSRAGTIVLALLLCLVAACATVEPPTGGPPDTIPPQLLSAFPDSGSVGLTGVDRLILEFSEKVQPVAAERILKFYPDLEVRRSKWKGRRRLTVELLDTLPADTVIVVELTAGYTDMHRVKSPVTRTIVLATSDSLPTGQIRALVTLDNEPVDGAVIELYALPHDSVSWDYETWVPKDPLRRASSDTTGWVTLDWLPTPGGPWLLRFFADSNHDMRAQENEAQRLWPRSWNLDADNEQLALGTMSLFTPSTAGRLIATSLDSTWNTSVYGWSEVIAESDTGLVFLHRTQPARGQIPVAFNDSTIWDPAGPNLCRLTLFADVDGDSMWSVLPDSSAVDTVTWWWEPFAVLDSLNVEPGRPLAIALPSMLSERIQGTAPPLQEMIPDSLSATATDSTFATTDPDSLPTLEDDDPEE